MIGARKIEERRWFMVRMIRLAVIAALVMFAITAGERIFDTLTQNVFGGGRPPASRLVIAAITSGHWLGLALIGILFEKKLARWLVPIPKDACVRCAYPMHGERPDRCPECGMPLGD